jgi:hypothetical protein
VEQIIGRHERQNVEVVEQKVREEKIKEKTHT